MQGRIFSSLLGILMICLIVAVVQGQPDDKRVKYWIFFTDKGLETEEKLERAYALAESQLSPRSLKRRSKVRGWRNLLDYTDLPVNVRYIEAIRNLGLKPIVVSKWLNAVSVKASPEEIKRIQELPFVRKVQRVAVFIRRSPGEEPPRFPKGRRESQDHLLDYGPSYIQNALIKVPQVHEMGINGQGVLITMLDTGFNYKGHEAFQNLKVVAEYDFINRDNITANEVGQDAPNQHNHGTMILSIIGGFKEGQLIGPAYGASFALAKTEYVPSETQIEEDYWVAGIEWADSLGADIVSSSLGYLDWYTYEDMDGNTAVTTIAADLAVSKGIVVVNAAGNERNNPWHYIIAPADGDSVIAVGAVDSEGEITPFSSAGPTYDGRIKPEVVAMGSGVYAASPYSPFGYVGISGTSASCPQVAGVCALILSANPDLTPMEVREALLMTADRADHPDTLYGWGLVNAWEAIQYRQIIFGNPEIEEIDKDEFIYQISIKVTSGRGIYPDSVFIHLSADGGLSFLQSRMSPIPNSDDYFATISGYPIGTVIKFYFSATDSSGRTGFLPPEAPDKLFTMIIGSSRVFPPKSAPPTSYRLHQNYPNPFNSYTIITFDLPIMSHVSLKVFNVLGQEIITLLDGDVSPGREQPVIWDGKDAKGKPVPAGLYFYRLKTREFLATKKMLLVR